VTGPVLTTRYKAGKADLRAALSPNGCWLATGAAGEEAVERWDLRKDRDKPPRPIRLTLWEYALEGLAVDQEGRVLVNAIREFKDAGKIAPFPAVSLWDPTDDALEPTTPFRHPRDIRNIRSMTFAGKKNFLTGSLARGEVRLWNIEQGSTAARMFALHIEGVEALAASADGRWALSGGRDNKVVLYDLSGERPPKTLGSHGGSVVRIAFGPPDGGTAVSAGLDQKFLVWDLATGTVRKSIPVPGDLVRCLAVAPDGSGFLAGVRNGAEDRVMWCDLNGKSLAEPYAVGTGALLSVAFSPDGEYALVYSAGDQTLHRWKLTRQR
jgi:WD40 repeat protein